MRNKSGNILRRCLQTVSLRKKYKIDIKKTTRPVHLLQRFAPAGVRTPFCRCLLPLFPSGLLVGSVASGQPPTLLLLFGHFNFLFPWRSTQIDQPMTAQFYLTLHHIDQGPAAAVSKIARIHLLRSIKRIHRNPSPKLAQIRPGDTVAGSSHGYPRPDDAIRGPGGS